MRLILTSALAFMMAAPAVSPTVWAQTSVSVPIPPATILTTSIAGDPDFCINKMAGFPTDDTEARFQFFRLTEEMAKDVTPEFRSALKAYSDKERVPADAPMLGVIEDIANPVLRQAAPEITIANMSYVIDFANICEPFIEGQVNSLKAFDPALENAEFNAVIVEDALFLRQILSESLTRLGVDEDTVHAPAARQYAAALVTTRDAAEFSTFEAELDDLEALYMEDLDGRLKRSNDMINEEMDREVLADSVALSDSMNKAAKKQAKERQLYTLIRILGGG